MFYRVADAGCVDLHSLGRLSGLRIAVSSLYIQTLEVKMEEYINKAPRVKAHVYFMN